MNGYNFTERCRKILALARDNSHRLRHEYVGTEHILLGIIEEGEGVAASVLHNLDVDFEELQQRIEEQVKGGRGNQASGDLPYTSRAKKVLEISMAEAHRLKHSYVGSEHLLLGLLIEEKGIAAQVLVDSRATIDRVRAETSRLLGAEFTPTSDTESIESFRIDITVHFPDGSKSNREFHNVISATHFLRLMGHRAAEQYDAGSAETSQESVYGRRPPQRSAAGGSNGYNFSERVRRVLASARDEAAALHHEYVGTEHVLLGLLREKDGVASATLLNLNTDAVVLRERILLQVKHGKSSEATGPDLPYTSRAKKVLELSMAEARDLGHSYVGTEHLLLGLIREEKGIAAQVLTDAGVRLNAARDEVVRLLGKPE